LPRYAVSQHADSAVRFGFAESDAKMARTTRNLGEGQVHQVWTYQSSTPFIHLARLDVAHGDTITSADPRSGQVY
jgi:hypothetical protein